MTGAQYGTVTGIRYRLDGGSSLSCGNNNPDTYLLGSQNGVVNAYGRAALPGIARGYCYFSAAGSILASHNVASVSIESTGVFKITWITPIPNPVCLGSSNASNADELQQVRAVPGTDGTSCTAYIQKTTDFGSINSISSVVAF